MLSLWTYQERGGRVKLFRVDSPEAAVYSAFSLSGAGYTAGRMSLQPIAEAAAVMLAENQGWRVESIDGRPYTPPDLSLIPAGYRDKAGRPVLFVQAGNGVLVPVRFDRYDHAAGTIEEVTVLSPVDMVKAADDEIVAAVAAACEVSAILREKGWKVNE